MQHLKDFINVPPELINMKKVLKIFNIEYIVLRMNGKHPFVLGRLPPELNHFPLLENHVMSTLYFAKKMVES